MFGQLHCPVEPVEQLDTEVILKAYREWGDDCPTHLHGMFAFAVWDRNRRTLFLDRDRLGKKPLYYARLADEQIAHI